MADNNNGKIVDPRTHETFTMNDLKKAFLA